MGQAPFKSEASTGHAIHRPLLIHWQDAPLHACTFDCQYYLLLQGSLSKAYGLSCIPISPVEHIDIYTAQEAVIGLITVLSRLGTVYKSQSLSKLH